MLKPAKSTFPALAMLLAVLAAACSPTISDPPAGGGQQQETERQAAADFRIVDLKVIDSQDRPEAPAKAESENALVLELINNYYDAAFLDPAKWTDGTHTILADYFTEAARGQVESRIGVMALGELAPKIESLAVDKEEITRLTYYFDSDLNSPLGIVSTNFLGTATPKEEGSPPIKIRHGGNFWIQREGEHYRIHAFSAGIVAISESESESEGEGR